MSSINHPRRSFITIGVLFAATLFWVTLGRGLATGAAPQPTVAQSSPVCVFGFSKDSCEGLFCCGTAEGVTCTRNGMDCRTVIVRDNIFKFQLRQSPGLCSDPASPTLGRCDETERLDGTVQVRGGFTLRYQQPCRFRGCWEGEFILETEEGIVGSGLAIGTLGTGSHRSPTCVTNAPCGNDCERCYEVQFIPNPDGGIGTWIVHLEGTLDGSITSGSFASSDLCVSVQGSLRSPGTLSGPTDVTEWDFCGTADGVVLAKCE